MTDLESIKAAWQQAAFSDAPDHSLIRYLDHQLDGIGSLSKTGKVDTQVLLTLTENLLSLYPGKPGVDLAAPIVYRQKMVKRMELQIARLGYFDDQPGFGYVLGLVNEVVASGPHITFTFGSLCYVELLVTSLAQENEKCVKSKLLQLNFNHLGYLECLITDFKNKLSLAGGYPARLAFLKEEIACIAALPEINGLCYHPDWPSLKTMWLSWLNEQCKLAPDFPPVGPKLMLNMSVAQLGCLLRLLYDEGIFKDITLTLLFQFFTTHFSTKKQREISHGGLSKEYYGTGQVTAAGVLDKLQKIAARLNRNFFPVWFAAGVIILFH